MNRVLKGLTGLYMLALIVAVLSYKAAFADVMFSNLFFGIYSVCVASYILSRFVFSLFYRSRPDTGVQPHIAIVMPGFSVRVIDFPENRGKRAAMAAGIRATSAEVVAFVDSDSVVEPNGLHALVQPFADARVGAVCGHANILNTTNSWLTRMQAVRYFVAFRVVKAAESVFGAVTCCSGCFSAYRREAILPRLEWWEAQRFLGVESTFGDDRSLTNCVLREWKILYEKRAVSHTIVPVTFRARFVLAAPMYGLDWAQGPGTSLGRARRRLAPRLQPDKRAPPLLRPPPTSMRASPLSPTALPPGRCATAPPTSSPLPTPAPALPTASGTWTPAPSATASPPAAPAD